MRTALTIAGSDSGAGAGIQADLKTFAAHGVYGTTAITAVTAQNTRGVLSFHEISPDLVRQQIEAVMSDIGADAAKTGMLPSAAIVEAVASAIADFDIPFVVVDPVMLAKSGDDLADDDAVAAMKASLLSKAFVVTPNIPEAERLSGLAIATDDDRKEAARRIHALGPSLVIVKGGHFFGTASPPSPLDCARGAVSKVESAVATGSGGARPTQTDIVDLLYDGHDFVEFRHERVPGRHTHGTGCTFAAALAAHLACGRTVRDAIPLIQEYIAGAITHAPELGEGNGPMNHFWTSLHRVN
jgi:hydroxymethylpyrimidine/phosphomethylpyrimidine kinase